MRWWYELPTLPVYATTTRACGFLAGQSVMASVIRMMESGLSVRSTSSMARAMLVPPPPAHANAYVVATRECERTCVSSQNTLTRDSFRMP